MPAMQTPRCIRYTQLMPSPASQLLQWTVSRCKSKTLRPYPCHPPYLVPHIIRHQQRALAVQRYTHRTPLSLSITI